MIKKALPALLLALLCPVLSTAAEAPDRANIVLIVADIPAGSVSGAPAMAFDLFSTCLTAARIDVPQSNGRYPVHGVSLFEHARSGGQHPLPDRYLFWDLWGKLAAFHDGWKLVGQIDNHRGRFAEAVPQIEAAKFELYHLPDDQAESRDVSAAEPEVYSDLKQRLIAWFQASTAKEK